MQRSSRKPTKRLRTPKVASIEGKAKAVRKRKLSKSPKGVSIVDEHVIKTRRTLSDSESISNTQVDKDKTTEETGVDSISILPLEQDIQGSCLLFLKKKQVVAIRGKAELEILQGNVDVMGFKTKTDQQTYQLFSPSCSSLLTIEECSTTDSSQSTAVKDLLVSQHPHLKKQAIASAQKAASVLLIKKVNDSKAEHVCRYKEYEDIFNATDAKENNLEKRNAAEKTLNNVTNPLGFSLIDANAERNSIYKEPEEWRNIINNINTVSGDKSPSILVCGGKGVGKSSFARYVINSLLNSCSEVCYLECDAGQTEFTPPAVLSLTHITKPIFGPPFTHLKWPEKAHFFGDLSPKDNPNFYIDCISSLYQYYQEICANDRDIPLVINTQGWVKGMGVPLLVDVIRVTKPSHIVQMNFPLTTKNLPTITRDFLDHSPGWSRPIERPEQTSKASLGDPIDNLSTKDEDRSEDNVASLSQPVIFQLETCTVEDPGSGSRFRPSDHRTMDLLAYFSRVHENQSNNEPTSKGSPPKGPTPITKCLPYKVPWSHVAVHVIHTKVPRSQVLVSLNASIVGLAISPHSMIEAHGLNESNDFPMFLKETPIVDCIGLGIIRNIDPINKLFYILTPVPLDKLRRVNTLLKGNLELPATMLLKEGQSGSPYVSSEFSFDIRGAGARKVRYNLQRKKYNTP